MISEKSKKGSDAKDSSEEFLDRLVFSEQNIWYIIFHCFIIFLHVTTSMMYAYMAAFRNNHNNYDELMGLSNFCESVFLIHIILNFFKQYKGTK